MGKRKTLGAPARRKPPQRRARSGAGARFQSLIRLSRSFYWESDSAHRFALMVHGPRYVSTQAPDSQIGKRRWEIPSTRPDAAGWEAHKAALDAHLAFRDFEFARVGPDGAERQFVVSGEPVFDAKGRFTGYCGIGEDVTERKRAEESVLRFRAAIDVSADLVLLVDPVRLRYIDVNDAACRALGYSREELLAMGPHDIFSISREDLALLYSRVIAGDLSEASVEGWYRCKDGSRLVVESSRRAVPSDKGHIIVAVARDIGERKRAERLQLLEHTVARRLADADNAAEALKAVIRAVCESENWEFGRYFRVDEKAGVTRFVESWCVPGEANQAFIEKSREIAYGPGVGLTGKAWQSGQALWVSDIHQDTRATQAVFTLDSGIHGAFVFPVKSEGKTIGVLHFNSRQIREPDERLLQAAGVIGIQIGQFLQRKQAEEALREAEERSRSLLMASPDGIWIHCNRRVEYVNSTLVNMLGYERAEEIVGREIYEMLPPGEHEAVRVRLEKVETERHATPLREHVMLKRDGGTLDVEVASSSFRQKDAVWIITIIRDISERKRGERLLLLEHTVARCLSDADSAADALKAVIRAVCETENWAFGRYFRVDEEAGALRFDEFWSVPGGGVEKFITGLSEVVFKPGVGLAGWVWQTGQPLWIADINRDDRAIQASFIPESGIRGAFVFPVKSEGKAIGVLAFNSREIREPDERLLDAVGVIGSQIGQFLRRKQAEEVLRESEERFRSLTQMSSDFFWETDAEYRFTKLVYGEVYTSTQPHSAQLGKTRWDIPSTRPDAAGWAAHKATLDAHLPFRDFEFSRLRPDDGTERHFLTSGEPRFGADGAFLGYRGIGRNVTDLVQARERIAQLAYTDPLTGLANRTSLGPALEHAVHLARRHERKLVIMFLDLDGFKTINDEHGHDIGDRLLIEVASRLRACLRSSDLVARLGGDEFVVVLEDMQDADQVEAVACKLIAEIARPYSLVAGEESRISASIGISMLPDDAGDARTLMKHADTAMYWAKQGGRNGYRFFAGESADPTTQDAGA